MQEKNCIQWRHITGQDNPADLASRGGKVSKGNDRWLMGPKWLTTKVYWLEDNTTTATNECLAETKSVTQIFKTATLLHDKFDQLLNQYDFWKTLRIY